MSEALSGWLYERVNDPVPDDAVVHRLGELGLDVGFREQRPTLLEEVKTDVELGERMMVDGTPEVFIAGIRLPAPAFFFNALNVECPDAWPLLSVQARSK